MTQTQDNRIDIPTLLARLPLFQALTAEQVGQIAAHAREKRLTKGEMLFQKGDPSHGFYVIIFGQLKLAFLPPVATKRWSIFSAPSKALARP